MPAQTTYTPEEYLALEREAEYKSEYIDGQIVAMIGASMGHNQITFNIAGLLFQQLRGTPCRAFSCDMRVHVKKGQREIYTYPDVVIVCGTPELVDGELDTLRNPTAIMEVLSPSTEKYDRGEKFKRYRTVPSLQEYLLIAQDTPFVEHYVRQGEQWLLTEISRIGDVIRLRSIAYELP